MPTSKTISDADWLEQTATQIRSAPKYRKAALPLATLTDLLTRELARLGSRRAALDSTREKLHHIVATYLGDPDYPAAAASLTAAHASRDPETVKTACRGILSAHASTRERLPLLELFYPALWHLTGQPQVILDLACGLNPFALPWMALPANVRYYAYDLHAPRVALINHFLALQGLPELAFQQDVLVEPPTLPADVALIFKEAHRMEARQPGCSRPLWLALNVRWLLVSLPGFSLTGRRDLADRHRALIHEILDGLPWAVTELRIGDELVFGIKKGDASND